MIVRRANVATPRTLTARIAKLEAYRPVTEENQTLVAELMELLRRRRQAKRMEHYISQMLPSNNEPLSGDNQ